MVVWLVDKKRFRREYEMHIRGVEGKYVNWMVEPDTGYLRFYITATHGQGDVFCHIHTGDHKSLPMTFKQDFMLEGGMILGVETFDEKKSVGAPSPLFPDISKKVIEDEGVINLD